MIFQALLKSLEENYRADLHKLALELATILAMKKEIIPFKYGLHILPEDLERFSKIKDNDQTHLHEFLEKMAETLDNAQSKPENWLNLRQIMIDLLKMENVSIQREIFNSVFDAMRMKAWSKLHFSERFQDRQIFCLRLFDKIFPMQSHPSIIEYKKKFAIISAPSYDGENLEIVNQTSSLDLSRRVHRFLMDYHELIFQNVDLDRDIGLLGSTKGKYDLSTCCIQGVAK